MRGSGASPGHTMKLSASWASGPVASARYGPMPPPRTRWDIRVVALTLSGWSFVRLKGRHPAGRGVGALWPGRPSCRLRGVALDGEPTAATVSVHLAAVRPPRASSGLASKAQTRDPNRTPAPRRTTLVDEPTPQRSRTPSSGILTQLPARCRVRHRRCSEAWSPRARRARLPCRGRG